MAILRLLWSSRLSSDGCSWKNEAEAEIHMNYVKSAIANVNPDIINFCEVEVVTNYKYYKKTFQVDIIHIY